ncbi:MAG: hypothetical protein RIS64_2153, partial [Bacteroidota bacterium]
ISKSARRNLGKNQIIAIADCGLRIAEFHKKLIMNIL